MIADPAAIYIDGGGFNCSVFTQTVDGNCRVSRGHKSARGNERQAVDKLPNLAARESRGPNADWSLVARQKEDE